MEELLRLLAMQNGTQFPEHGMKVGDRVRMVNVDSHGYNKAGDLIQNGEEGTVVSTELFLGMMPVFEVRPDAGRTINHNGEPNDIVPFANQSDFNTVVKIEQ